MIIIIFIKIFGIFYLFNYLVQQNLHKFPVTVSSNAVAMDLSLLLCSSGMYVRMYIACMLCIYSTALIHNAIICAI